MRITIRREEQKIGFFGGKVEFVVAFTIQMNEQEVATAKHVGIADHNLFLLEDRDPPYQFPVRLCFKGQECRIPFQTLGNANEFEETLKENLRNLKSHLEAESRVGEVETF